MNGKRGEEMKKLILLFVGLLIVLFSFSCSKCSTCPGGDMCGDVNGDGQVNRKDWISLSNYLFNGGSMVCLTCADVNSDHKIDMEDATILSHYLLDGEPVLNCSLEE